MNIRLWCVLVVLSLSVEHGCSARKEFSISEVCENFATYYSLIKPKVELKINLDFKRGNLFVQGEGSVIFSPKLDIKKCTARKQSSSIIRVTMVIKDDFSITSSRPWLQVQEGLFTIIFTIKETTPLKVREVKISTINAICSKGFQNGKELESYDRESLMFKLSYLLNEQYQHRTFRITDVVSESMAKQALNQTFQYYMARIH